MSVIQKILVLMEKEKVNARKLTTDLGLSNSCITEWKKGKAKPSIEAVVKIAGYFGVTTDYLLFDNLETEAKSQMGSQKTILNNQENDQTEENVRFETVRRKWNCTAGDLQSNESDSDVHKDKTVIDTGNVLRRGYREYGKGRQESDGYSVELSGEDRKLLDCYHRLDEEDKEYIWCKMIVLEREAMD